VELAQHPRQLAARFGFRSVRPKQKGEVFPRYGFSGVGEIVKQGAILPGQQGCTEETVVKCF
jgi:hypothetical protein